METKINYSKEKKMLLDTVAQMDLPIVITGKPGSGKRDVAKYLKDVSDRHVFDINKVNLDTECDGLNIDISEEQCDLYSNKLIYIAWGPSGVRYPQEIGNHVQVKCFSDKEDNSKHIHIALVKKDSDDFLDVLNHETPVVLISGPNALDYKHKYIHDKGIMTFAVSEGSDLLKMKDIIQGRIAQLGFANAKKFTDFDMEPLHFEVNSTVLSIHPDVWESCYRILRVTGVLVTIIHDSELGLHRTVFDSACYKITL